MDDDPVIRAILRSTLAGIGLGVSLAENGEAAIALASRLPVGLFMLDLQMPGLNGLQTCRRIRALSGYAETPVVVLTGHNGAQAHAAAVAAGCTMFLAKPFKPAALLGVLGPILAGGDPQEKLASGGDGWTQADPDYRNQVWGRLDAQRAAASAARGENDLDLD